MCWLRRAVADVAATRGELAFLRPLPVERLWGVGRVTAAKLRERGIEGWRKRAAAVTPSPLIRQSHARGGVSVLEIAEEVGNLPSVSLNTYRHVIRELKGHE